MIAALYEMGLSHRVHAVKSPAAWMTKALRETIPLRSGADLLEIAKQGAWKLAAEYPEHKEEPEALVNWITSHGYIEGLPHAFEQNCPMFADYGVLALLLMSEA